MKYLEESTILNYMNTVISVRCAFEQGYSFDWHEPGPNFYMKRYRIAQTKNDLWIHWVNLQDNDHFIRLRKPKYKFKFMNDLYFLFHRRIETTDLRRFQNVLKQVVYPDFCKELALVDTDFSRDYSIIGAADHVMVSLYENFFSSIPVERYIDMFGLKKKLSKDSLLYLQSNCKQSTVNG